MPKRLRIAKDVAGIGIACDQPQRHLFAATTDQDGNMRLLHAFGLIDRAAHMIVLALENRFFLGPHRANHLHRLAKTPQPLRGVGVVVAIATILVFTPARADAKVEPPMTQHVY